VSEPEISTLARRLAEQNNVDWRGLRGSGPAGKVVERDVLDYLAKVMAGEEAVNPTPEPVPEGMEAWPEQDIQGFRAGVGEAATLGELRDELGSASRDYLAGPVDEEGEADEPFAVAPDIGEADVAVEPAYGAAAEATGYGGSSGTMAGTGEGGDEGIDEDIFLFEDDDAPAVGEPGPVEAATLGGAPAAAGAPAVAGGAAGAVAAGESMQADDLDDLLVAGDDFDVADAGDVRDTYATSSEDSRFGGVATGYLGGDGQGDGLAEPPGLGVPPAGYDADSRYTADRDGGTPEPAAPSSGWGDDIGFGSASASTHDQGGDVPDLWGPAASAASDDSDLWTGPAGAAIDSFTDTPFADAIEAAEQPRDGWSETEPAAFGSAPAEPVAPGDSPQREASLEDVVDATSEAAGEIGVGLAAVGATLLTAGAATLPLARPGTILRRNIDVSALAAAQLAVGHELGFDEPLGASAFLLRAVVKAAASTGFSAGAVGLAALDEGVTIKRVDGASDMSFADLVKAIAGAAGEEDEPALVAADLSGLDVDEAVLELAAPVVSLGRILYDNQRGAYRSMLTLTGPMPLDTAAKLLARVAELLDAPVRLVL